MQEEEGGEGEREGGSLLYLNSHNRTVPSEHEHVYRGDLDRSRLHVFLTYPNPWLSSAGSQPLPFLRLSPDGCIYTR